MLTLQDLVKKNNHKLVKYDQCEISRNYISVFNYSEAYGGTYNSFRYYNDFVVDVTP